MAGFQLSNEQTGTLRDMAQDLAQLEDVIAKAERAGLDMSEQRARLEYAKTLREGFLREFGKPVVQRK